MLSKLRYYGGVPFIQRAVIEYLVAEKESVTDIHKQLNNAYGGSAAGTSTASRWASRIAGSEKGQAGLSDSRRSGWPTTA
jgi:hypothetical protein